ncbi:MAG: amidohydrolase [Desulfomonile tiedjei]|uniref:Amidohydrolase n=1 Tax=Desulfomonile tiedjei TaxID=2358 RepID=A0A9D6Z6G2_9BACT|nr:amidohydrolase [Desulfomonile tiedjei]
MIIDCHVHLLPKRARQDRTSFVQSDRAFGSLYSSQKAKLASESEIIEYMDRSEIEKAVVFGFPWEDHRRIAENNDEIWDFHHRYPDRIIPFAVLSTAGDEQNAREAERTVRGGFAGLGELAVYDRGWSASDFEALSPCLKIAESAGVPVMIHVNEPVGHHYPGKIPVDFHALVGIIEAHPGLDFILAHFGGGVFVYGLMPEVAAVLSRTYLDTAASPFLYDSRIFEIASKILGPDKIVFGSDFPLLPLSRYLKELEKSGIQGSLQKAILGDNFQSILARPREK